MLYKKILRRSTVPVNIKKTDCEKAKMYKKLIDGSSNKDKNACR